MPARRRLPLAWNGAAVGAPAVGRLTVGAAPGLLALPLLGRVVTDPFEQLLSAAARPAFRWLARFRPEVPAP